MTEIAKSSGQGDSKISADPPPEALEHVSDTEHSTDGPPLAWNAELEVVFFHALARFRPVGVHKHFRMLSAQRFFTRQTGLEISINQLWAHLANYYDLRALDAMADEADDDISLEARKKRSAYPFKIMAEFNLPNDEYESIITEHRKAVTPPPERGPQTRRGARLASPATESTRSTPEPHPEPDNAPATAPVKRGVGRPRKNAKKDVVPLSEPPLGRRTRAALASQAATTPTPAAKRARRNA
ncbi:chromatin modification-related protein EAF7-domain-containing protein [Phlyctochytrium arcticum]|nr:chromatin modification-related protein EAF7-domain-containing protein [Phlyctochytrium arcticum]